MPHKKFFITVVAGLDLNQRPSGYEPDELPDCSTPQRSEHEVYESIDDWSSKFYI